MLILVANLAATLAMAGIIWFVQIVHYPLFAEVSSSGLAHYETLHATRTGWVVAPLMLVELATSLALLVPRLRPPTTSPAGAGLGAGLVAVIWLSTFVLQVPLHDRLAEGGDAAVGVARLVATNWIRTVAWTVRALLVLSWVAGR